MENNEKGRITNHEARYAILTDLIRWITLYDKSDEDVYTEGFVPKYLPDERLLINEDGEKLYYPTEDDIVVFQLEANKIYRLLSLMKMESTSKYNQLKAKLNLK